MWTQVRGDATAREPPFGLAVCCRVSAPLAARGGDKATLSHAFGYSAPVLRVADEEDKDRSLGKQRKEMAATTTLRITRTHTRRCSIELIAASRDSRLSIQLGNTIQVGVPCMMLCSDVPGFRLAYVEAICVADEQPRPLLFNNTYRP
jgi:hypothetical protein